MRVTPESFYNDQPPQRILSSECEYNQQGSDSDRILNSEVIAEAFAASSEAHAIPFQHASRLLLGNGAMIYLELEKFAEYNAPEGRGPHEAAAADLAGIIIMQRLGKEAGQNTKIYRRTGTALLQKHAEHEAYSSGYHLNAIMPSSAAVALASSPLMPSFLATSFWSGGGMMTGQGFVLSQKAEGIGGEPISTVQNDRRTAHGNKPMLTIMLGHQDQDVNPENGYTRIERRFADAGLSRWGRFMDIAGTSLICRLVEHADKIKLPENCLLLDPVQAAKQASLDLNLTEKYQTMDKKHARAVDIQKRFGEIFVKLSKVVELPKTELQAIDELFGICDSARACDPKNHDYTPICDAVDWAAKYHYISHKLGTPAFAEKYEKAAMADLVWDRVYPEGPGMRYWDRVGKRQSIVDKRTVEQLMTNPPQHTRAVIRAHHVRYSHIVRSGWSGLELESPTGSQHTSLHYDPYSTKLY